MSKDGSSVKMARPGEPEAVRTTIVGGRPPAKGAIPRNIPRGIEVLLKKAAVDPAFKDILFEKRAGAAEAIGLELTLAEEVMLAAVPLPQLEGIVAHTRVAPKFRPAFLGYAAGAMLAALGGALLICDRVDSGPKSRRGNETIEKKRRSHIRPSFAENPSGVFEGDLDLILSSTAGIRTDRPRSKKNDFGHGVDAVTSLGIRPSYRSTKNPPIKLVSVEHPTSVGGTGAADADRSPAAIASVIQRHLAGIENAYNSALKRNPNLDSGKITLRFTISPAGEVTYAEIIQDTLGAPAVNDAVLSRVKCWRFPPTGGEDVVVIYPFVFAPA